jgi:uncharacterized protein YjiS (DUF1127 family)
MTSTDFSSIAAVLAGDLAHKTHLGRNGRTKPLSLGTSTGPVRRTGAIVGLLSALTLLAARWVAHIRHRDQFHNLMKLDDRMLADIGVDRDNLWSALQGQQQTSVPD